MANLTLMILFHDLIKKKKGELDHQLQLLFENKNFNFHLS